MKWWSWIGRFLLTCSLWHISNQDSRIAGSKIFNILKQHPKFKDLLTSGPESGFLQVARWRDVLVPARTKCSDAVPEPELTTRDDSASFGVNNIFLGGLWASQIAFEKWVQKHEKRWSPKMGSHVLGGLMGIADWLKNRALRQIQIPIKRNVGTYHIH